MYTNDKTILRLVRSYAPEGFNKKQARITAAESVPLTGRNWSGGYKTHYVAVHLESGRAVEFEDPAWDAMYELNYCKLSEGIALLAYHWQGLSKSVDVYVHPSNLVPQLEVEEPLTDVQRVILYVTRSYKNSYGGETDIRRKEAARAGCQLSPDEWEKEQSVLCQLGYLDKRGALTLKGKNAANGQTE